MGSISHCNNSDSETTIATSESAESCLTAIVKGGGPSGLAAGVTLARLNFQVTVVERRPWRPYGGGRKNMVALRPDALSVLDDLGALKHLAEVGALTDLVEGLTVDEWDEQAPPFDWAPLLRRYPHGYGEDGREEGSSGANDHLASKYESPGRLDEQLPSSYVDLGELEDALLKVCEDLDNIKVVNNATIELEESTAGGKIYQATLIEALDSDGDSRRTNIGHPDLIICASGKNDAAVAQDIGFTRRVGVKFDNTAIPNQNSHDLHLGPDHELESQLFAVFGVITPEKGMGSIHHQWRKEGTGKPPQPLCEIEMTHKSASHCVYHIPRDIDVTDKPALEAYLIRRINAKLGTGYESFGEIREKNVLVAGDPLRPVVVETSTAPKFVFGKNVVLIGDVAMCCSPSSGIGADIGVTFDSQSIKNLGMELMASRQSKSSSERENIWETALDVFNRRKAESAVMWSQASRKFYISAQEAEDILKQIRG